MNFLVNLSIGALNLLFWLVVVWFVDKAFAKYKLAKATKITTSKV